MISLMLAGAMMNQSLSGQDPNSGKGLEQGPDPKIGRKIIWADEFAKEGRPDPSKWNYEVGKVRNGEAQYYTKDRPKNSRVKGGSLVIEAHKEAFEGAAITSASLESKAAWSGVYVEVKAKIPTGRGTWPAIWMLGDAIRQKGDKFIDWPSCGEIDILENVGFDPERIHFNIHCEAYNHMKGNGKGASIVVPKAWEDFHVYGMDMKKDRLDFYFDGKRVFTYAKESDDRKVWPYGEPHYLILNLAIGGSWGGAQGIDDAIFPSVYTIDYVRVYK